ncbi:hypothetical protein D3C76_1593540 [compost metagenome]
MRNEAMNPVKSTIVVVDHEPVRSLTLLLKIVCRLTSAPASSASEIPVINMVVELLIHKCCDLLFHVDPPGP